MLPKERTSVKLFNKYSYLAHIYANRVFSYQRLGLAKEDVVQEFKIKIWTSIKRYAITWGEYRSGKRRYKPMPLKFYLQLAMANKLKDFVRLISREKDLCDIDDLGIDLGSESSLKINVEDEQIYLNDIDLLQGLEGDEKTLFLMYLTGYTHIEMRKAFPYLKKRINCIISTQTERLTKFQKELREKKSLVVIQTFEE